MTTPPRTSLWRSLRTVLIVVVVVVLYAYAVEETEVDFGKIQEESRQTQFARVMRALADPELFLYKQDSESASAQMHIPCGGQTAPSVPRVEGRPYLVLDPTCASKGEPVRVEGFGFHANGEGSLEAIPADPAGSRLVGTLYSTDASGHFETAFNAPTLEETLPVTITAHVRWNVAGPYPTQSLIDTWEKIVETVYLALMATTLGLFLAVPLSFLAARNIMAPISTPFGGLVAALFAAPLGAFAGGWLFGQLGQLGVALSANALIGLGLLLLSLGAIWAALYLSGFSRPADVVLSFPRLRRALGLPVLILLAGLMLSLLGGFGHNLGLQLRASLGAFGFLGNFLLVIGNAINVFLPVLGALIGLALLSVLAQRALASAELRVSPAVARAINFVIGGLSVALIVGLIFALIAWLRDTPALEFAWAPALIAGVAGAGLTLFVPATRTIPIGNIIYYATRTFFNVVRAVEPLIYGLVFVIWVGLGPFAGTLALTVHTVATLGKLYSEQVENIMPGPIEAITATGANRLQTIVYAVIPQIVAPFISFTLYRWDVNVRSSTILGFVGGGGIGFILYQNIQLLRYRAASTNILAIAIVVIILDYVSARVREKYV